MMKKMLMLMSFLMVMNGVCAAESWELDLNAGSTSLSGGVHYKSFLDTAYLKVGGTGVMTDDDDTEYKWASFDFTVGSDTLQPGLNTDVGLRAILGTAEERNVSDDVGAVGFTAAVDYLFSRDVIPIPLELFSSLTWAPTPLSFRDTETFFEFNLGAGIRIIKNAAITATYSNYHIKLETDGRDWTLNDDVFRFGVSLRF